MDKDLLIEIMNNARENIYSWSLYFFKIDRRNNNPFTAYKIRFKNNEYLPEYARILIDMVVKYQLDKITEIKDYTGENTKVSCDRIETNNVLVKEQWDYFVEDIACASDEKIEGKYNGYVLEGTPSNNDGKSLVFLKMANPIINLKNKRNVVFTFDADNELAEMTDEVCKLRMDADCIVIDEVIYSFNYKFEDLLNMDKTMQKVKTKALEKIFELDAFENKDEFEQMARAYKAPRTFITLKSERVNRIKNKTKRKAVASMLNIEISDNGKFVFKNEEEVSLLLRYLCFKVFKDAETKYLLEANNVTKLELNWKEIFVLNVIQNIHSLTYEEAEKFTINSESIMKMIELDVSILVSGERKNDAEVAMEKWIYNVLESSENKEDRKQFFDTSKYKSYLVSNNEKVKYILIIFL